MLGTEMRLAAGGRLLDSDPSRPLRARGRRAQAWRLASSPPAAADPAELPPRARGGAGASPRQPVSPRVLARVPPHSLAAGLLAAGVRDAPLGLERLPRRPAAPARSRAAWLWGVVAAGVLAIAVLGARGDGSAPQPAAPATESTTPPTSALRVSVRPVETNYTVMPGDTLERIAQRFGTTVEAIAAMNNLRDYNQLRVGQKLIIP